MALKPQLTVVIPTRNEAGRLPLLLADLARGSALISECIVVDGGSSDGTPQLATLAGANLVRSAAGRGPQLLAGIEASSAPWLWLLHADARLPPDWPRRLAPILERFQGHSLPLRAWYGALRIELPGPAYRCLEWLVTLRSAVLQRPYGDQGLLLLRNAYCAIGGLRPLALMEDLDFAERFARQGRFYRLPLAVSVDGRRWQRLGLLGTTLANAALRRAWRRGASPAVLAERYGAYQKAQRRSSGSSSQP